MAFSGTQWTSFGSTFKTAGLGVSRRATGGSILQMDRSFAVLGTVVIVMTATSCSSSTNGYRIATETQPDGAGMLALINGSVLFGRVNGDGTACLWVGDDPNRTAILWPYGFYANDSPLAVFDSSGHQVAVTGRRIRMGGGLEPDSVHSILGCSGFVQFWAANGPPQEL